MKRETPLTGLVFTCLTLLVLLTSIPLDVLAQAPPDSLTIGVAVTTDKQQYKAGEPVQITVRATNLLDQAQTLNFSSSLQADYAVDAAWRWSTNRGFLAVMTAITIGPRETYTFPVFTHQPSDYFLASGRHRISGDIGRHGSAGTAIFVGEDSLPPPPSLLLTPGVSPSPAPFGAPVSLSATVTNISNVPQTFGHDGCPVRFTVDGWFTPDLACPEYYRQVTLQPGESIVFGAADYPYLTIGPPVVGSILTPGWHGVEMDVAGVGRTGARLQIVGGGGSIAGTAITADGERVQGAIIGALSATSIDSSGPVPPGTLPPVPNRAFSTRTDEFGRYLLDNLPPDLYYVNAWNPGGDVVWYPGVPTREQAVPVPVTEGSALEGIDFILKGETPPIPPPGVIVARVTEALPPGSMAVPQPLMEAVVAAIPLNFMTDGDSGWVPPGDSTNVPRGATRRQDGPAPPPRPPLPREMWRDVFFGFADSTGQVVIRVPYGQYHLVAFTMRHRYQWWENAARLADARVMEVSINRRPQVEALFELSPLQADAPPATLVGQVRAFGYGPDDSTIVEPPPPPTSNEFRDDPAGGEPRPLPDADVVARPLVMDPRIMTFAAVLYPARTDAEGRYRIDAPATVPYLVQSWTEGYEPQYYDHASFDGTATPVDVAPGETTPGVDFDLYRGYVPPDLGAITGFVYQGVGGTPAGVADVIYPLPRALVRVRSAVPGIGPHEMVTRSDENGYFRIDGLPKAGDDSWTYYVSAEAEGFLPASFPGVFHWRDAEPVAPTRPGSEDPVRIVLVPPAAAGPHFLVGLVRAHDLPGFDGWPPIELPPMPDGWADSSGAGDPGYPYPGPADSTGSYWPLLGAYVYLVPADDPRGVPLAAGVACDNGTVVLDGLPAGSYKAYADFPGFESAWFHGSGPFDAGVVVVGPGVEPVLLDFVLESTQPPPDKGNGDGQADAAPNALVELRNAPNPFRPQTTILYRLVMGTDVTVQVFDLNGRLVRTLVDSQSQPAGEQRIPWDGRDGDGRAAGAGIYFYRVWTPLETQTGKMVMLR